VLAAKDAVPFYEALGFLAVGEERTELGPMATVMAKTIAGSD
jgi:hypothetical protein